MRHIVLSEYGDFAGIHGARLKISQKGEILQEYPLSRVKSITLAKSGVSVSSDLLQQCAIRGIRLNVLDFRSQVVSSVYGMQHHATASVRMDQFESLNNEKSAHAASAFIYGKVRNQRAVLLYFSKYANADPARAVLKDTANNLKLAADNIKQTSGKNISVIRNTLLGFEGSSASAYWSALSASGLLTESFSGRRGRGASDIVNSCLNFGYAILLSSVWNTVVNAGLEPYCGLLHTQRPGKPSLVLDIMEEYRAWVVDRTVIKMRADLKDSDTMSPAVKKRLITEIHNTMAKKYDYGGKKVRLESIIQRQTYRLSGYFRDAKKYRPFLFRW